MSRTILTIGRSQDNPLPLSDWQRERASGPLLPIASEFSGRRGWLTWAVALLVAVIFWMEVFA